MSEEADPPRPNKRRRPIEGELAGLEQEAEEESSRAAETVCSCIQSYCGISLTSTQKMRADAYLPKRKGVSSKKKELKVISKNWTPGWLEYIDESIRPLAVSRNLVMHLLVMSTWMSLGDARQALLKGAKGLRPFGPAEVRDATEKFLGRGWSELKSEALEKLR